ncbi:MAG: tetratricopeptide repeat protein [Thaumarchaeota archaeon S15]|nr:MAG: tetratricopeptide repeat protein [Thaumarchaeota archaeon S15]
MAKKAETRLSENDEVNRILHEGIKANPEGRHAEVLEPLKRAVGLEPENPVTHMIYGQTLLPLGRPAEALEAFGRAAVLRPELPQVHEFRAMALFHLSRFEDALLPLGRLLEINAEYPRAQFNVGLALAHLGRHAEALAAYDRAAAQARAVRGLPVVPGPEHPSEEDIAFPRSVSELALGGPPAGRAGPARWTPP